jgi:anti-sigma-K factor RskA
MADHPTFDELSDVETLLRSLDATDLELTEPPSDVWAGIERTLAELSDHPAPVVSLAERRRHRLVRPLLAAVAVSGLLIAGAVVLSTRNDGEPFVVANAELEYDPANFDPLGASARATVSLVEDADGLAITIDDAELPTDLTESADLELWLIEPDADGNVADLVSLGIVEGDTFAVPAGYDPALYSVVDISVEPRDGDDAHSGRSILRGALANA